MPDFTTPTGTAGTLIIRDDGVNNVDLIVRNAAGSAIQEIPWTYTLNGVKESLRNESLLEGEVEKLFIRLFVGAAQTITFHLGDTNSTELAGPTDLSAYIQRGTVQGTVNITVGNLVKKAIPYINVNGVWKQAEPYSRFEGNWKQTK